MTIHEIICICLSLLVFFVLVRNRKFVEVGFLGFLWIRVQDVPPTESKPNRRDRRPPKPRKGAKKPTEKKSHSEEKTAD
jgi:hypothetical protein